GRAGTFDDFTTWTGSIIRRDGEWVMVYTGTARAERGLVQRIGVATSPDLLTWTRLDGAVLAADPAHYDLLDTELWGDEAWRDPWAFVDPDDGQIHVLVTARAGPGDYFDRGVIGHARTADLRNWDTLSPLDVRATGFGQLEVPQLFGFADRWYLLVSSDTSTQSPTRRATGPGTGTYYFVADAPCGPFEMIGNGALVVDAIGSSYAGRVHTDSDGVTWFLDWERCAPDGSFVGRLSRPRQLHARPDGSLYVDAATA
ncbi:MAG: glycosyl hydrolase family 32, partial [Ilumatobacteraceae bacterium]